MFRALQPSEAPGSAVFWPRARVPAKGGCRLGLGTDEARAKLLESHTEYLTFTIPARMALRNITAEVEAAVRKSGEREGLVLVNAMHVTASVFINDDEPELHQDYAD